MGVLLEVRDVRIYFPLHSRVLRRRVGWIKAVDGVSLTVEGGETLALVGESGSGKTTLGRGIVRLTPLRSGSISLGGEPWSSLGGEALRRRRRRAQMVFQDPYSSLDPRQRVGAILEESLKLYGELSGPQRRDAVESLLTDVGLGASLAARLPHQLSGGQRQRVSIARSLSLKPDLVVFDEPTSALDVSIQAQVLALVRRLQSDRDFGALFITHNLAIVGHVASRVAVMYLGRIVETGRVAVVLRSPLHPYTAALMSAAPDSSPSGGKRRRIVLRGDIPSPASPPTGCTFNTRCWLREQLGDPERCVAERPLLRPVTNDKGHLAACHFAEEMVAIPPA